MKWVEKEMYGREYAVHITEKVGEAELFLQNAKFLQKILGKQQSIMEAFKQWESIFEWLAKIEE